MSGLIGGYQENAMVKKAFRFVLLGIFFCSFYSKNMQFSAELYQIAFY